ncbi:glycerophosphodiester phosphodiesterase GDPD4 [Ananas comosus]|uniref:glycerophosphodiester phosphodiesterase n=1 Tax=Ananas comosus TaxID=4615 RepID=A0A199V3L8_ANACO|nr:glycerophosphodiester phosphodiesterase GDPD4 [Ananas comosus]OAY71659.1 Glycerophosphodiester phosphodiesterase GDPD4 [Ananas comosus]
MRGARVPQQWRWRKPPPPPLPLFPPKKKLRLPRLIPSNRFFRLLLLLAFLALVPPVFFHLRLQRLHQMRSRKCGWIADPPLVCAHGGDSTKGVPNTMAAYRIALSSHVDCIEIDVSRSSDGGLFALHDRDLQRMSGNNTVKVGYMSINEIKALDAGLHWKPEFHNQEVPFLEDALLLISQSVKQVILDVKVGPPSYEQGLAADILSVVKKTHCRNCLVWAKSDIIGRDVIKLSQDVPVGYIVMKDPSTGVRSNLLRMKGAKVVGVYHPLIDNDLIRVLRRRGKKIYAWTVDDLDSMQRMLFEHVDAIVTSNPSMLQGLMEDLRMQCLEEGFTLP